MPEVSTHAPGSFCWIDLGTSDAGAAKKFYSGVFGWEFQDSDMPEGGTYSMVRVGGREIGGLYAITKEMKEQGVPPHWLSYICVESADATSNAAEAAGAEIKQGPMDVMEVGRMSVIQDPTGAMFAIWQPKAHHGATVVNEPGAVCWHELLTRDVAAAKTFYGDVFRYDLADHQMGPTKYTFLMNGDTREAGLMAIPPEAGAVPSYWMIYFTVSDTDSTIETAKSLGGKVLAEPTDVPGVGRFATLQDPQGAVFSIIRLNG